MAESAGGPGGVLGRRRAVARMLRAWPAVLRAALLLAGLSPLLVWGLQGLAPLDALVSPFGAWFEYQCHREPGRSAAWLGRALPVCHRCLGIYLGLAMGALLERPRLAVWPLRLWVLGAALLMVLDVATEAVGLRGPWAPLRLFSGLFLGWPVAVVVLLGARETASAAEAFGGRGADGGRAPQNPS